MFKKMEKPIHYFALTNASYLVLLSNTNAVTIRCNVCKSFML